MWARLKECDIISLYSSKGLTLLERYKGTKYKHKCEDAHGYLYALSKDAVENNCNYRKYNTTNPYSTLNIMKALSESKRGIALKEGQLYTGDTDTLIFVCEKHGEFPSNWHNMKNKPNGCPFCAGKCISDDNRVSTQRKDLIKYFNTPEDAALYSIGSSEEYLFKCPECKMTKPLKIHHLTSAGFSCPVCSDGISIPEKFCANIFNNIGYEYISQKGFNWAKGKRYDFYLPSFNMIIEVHGIQHYKQTSRVSRRNRKNRTIMEEQENDMLKEQLAKENGIEHYIVIDCRKSEFEWLKENYIEGLSSYFDFKNINWNEIWADCQKSIMPSVWDLWNELKNVTLITDKIKIDRTTIVKYLKIGAKLGFVVYDSKLESINGASKAGKSLARPIGQYDMNMNLINMFSSAMNVEEILSIKKERIRENARGRTSHTEGFLWRYHTKDEYLLWKQNNKEELQ